jgi:putative flippase GtrA
LKVKQEIERLGEMVLALNFRLIVKYLSVSIAMYLAVLLSMYVLVEVLGLFKTLAYVVTYLSAYVLDYLVNLRFLFYRDHSWTRVGKYVLQIAVFLVVGALIFRFLIAFEVNYLIATLMTAIVLMPLRFFAYKLIVFR